MSHVKLRKWGNCLAVRFPPDVVRKAGLIQGDVLDIQIRGSNVCIRKRGHQGKTAPLETADDSLGEAGARTLDVRSARDLREEGQR
jgi:antitoxin component of MazEF toxin-antitoxin module